MDKSQLKELKTKLMLGSLKYTSWALNILIVFGILFFCVNYVLYIFEST